MWSMRWQIRYVKMKLNLECSTPVPANGRATEAWRSASTRIIRGSPNQQKKHVANLDNISVTEAH